MNLLIPGFEPTGKELTILIFTSLGAYLLVFAVQAILFNIVDRFTKRFNTLEDASRFDLDGFVKPAVSRDSILLDIDKERITLAKLILFNLEDDSDIFKITTELSEQFSNIKMF